MQIDRQNIVPRKLLPVRFNLDRKISTGTRKYCFVRLAGLDGPRFMEIEDCLPFNFEYYSCKQYGLSCADTAFQVIERAGSPNSDRFILHFRFMGAAKSKTTMMSFDPCTILGNNGIGHTGITFFAKLCLTFYEAMHAPLNE